MQRELVLALELGRAFRISIAIIKPLTPAARGGGDVRDDLGREGGRERGREGAREGAREGVMGKIYAPQRLFVHRIPFIHSLPIDSLPPCLTFFPH